MVVAPVTVCHLRTCSGYLGGAESVILATAPRFDPARYVTLMAALAKPGQDLAPVTTAAHMEGLPFVELPGRRIFDPGQFRALLRLLGARKVGILHSHDPKSDLLSWLCGLCLPRLRRVITLHGWVVRPGSRKSAWYLRLDKAVLRRSQAVIAVSAPLADEAKRHGARRVLFLPNAIDPVVWRPAAADPAAWPDLRGDSPFVVGYVGRLSVEKAPRDFLAVARKVADALPGVRFVLAGAGPEEAAVRRDIEALGLTGQVRLLGQLDAAAIRDLAPRLDCLLSPSHTEGLPVSLLEAMAMGVPVVATDVGGVGQIIADGETGLLRPRGDIDGLAEAVLAVARDPALAAGLAGRARKRVVASFSLDANVAAITDLYDTVLRDRGRP